MAEVLDYEVPSDEETGGAARAGGGSPDESFGAPTPLRDSQMGDNSSVHGDDDDGEGGEGEDGDNADGGEDEDGSSSEDGSGYDSDLLAEIHNQMGGEGAKGGAQATDEDDEEDESGSDGGLFGHGSSEDEDEEEGEEEDDAETVEQKKRIRLLQGETNDLDKAIVAKEAELAKQSNPIFKVSLPRPGLLTASLNDWPV